MTAATNAGGSTQDSTGADQAPEVVTHPYCSRRVSDYLGPDEPCVVCGHSNSVHSTGGGCAACIERATGVNPLAMGVRWR